MRRYIVLIVDDECGIRRLLTTAFTRAGYDVRTAGSGPEAVALCGAEHVDAVLSDVKMPGMNGHELRRWLAEHQPETRFALMSGYDDVCEGLPESPCPLLQKPFRPKDAVAAIDELIAVALP